MNNDIEKCIDALFDGDVFDISCKFAATAWRVVMLPIPN